MWVFQTPGAAPAHSAGDHENDNHDIVTFFTGLPPTRRPETLTFVTKWYFPVLQQHGDFTLHRSQDFDSVGTSKIHALVQSR